VVAALKRSKGATHPAVAGSEVSLATLYLRRGNLAAADSLLTASLPVMLESHGPRHLGVARSEAMLGEVALRQHQYARAEPLLREALAVLEVTGSATKEEIERARRNLEAAEGGGQAVRRSGGQ
jgi:ATP/maltotriose-dependent transcriptional regulator MalT